MRASPGEAFVANTAVLENRSAELVSADREVRRANDDPGNFAALRLTKEVYQRAGSLGNCQRGCASRRTRRRIRSAQFRIAAGVSNRGVLGDRSPGNAATQSARMFRNRN